MWCFSGASIPMQERDLIRTHLFEALVKRAPRQKHGLWGEREEKPPQQLEEKRPRSARVRKIA
jgi:hypothetical protein